MTRSPAWQRAEFTRREPCCAWDDADDGDRLSALEGDVRESIRELAAARLALSEMESEHRATMEAHLLGLLDVIDGFERVLASVRVHEADLEPRVKSWAGNFRTVSRLLSQVVREQGVTPIETPTNEFDPRWHTAIETMIDPSLPAGTIVEVIKRGYVWQQRVLRKAEVAVIREDATE